MQVKELKEAFEGMEKDGKGKGSLKAERLTRAQAREAEMAGGDDGSGAPVTSEPEGQYWYSACVQLTRLTASIHVLG